MGKLWTKETLQTSLMNIIILACGRLSFSKRFFKDGGIVRSKKAEISF